MPTTLLPAGAQPPATLTPTQRAAVRVALAHALGDGRPVTRAQIITDLLPPVAVLVPPVVTPTCISVELLPDPATVDVPAPDPTPDVAVSFGEAAGYLGLSVSTIRRYSAPSSGRLVRLHTGVSLASVEALAGAR